MIRRLQGLETEVGLVFGDMSQSGQVVGIDLVR